MNLKKIVIIAVILLIVSLAGYLLTKKKATVTLPFLQPRPTTQLPQSEVKIPTEDKIKVSDKDINNVYKTAIEVTDKGDVLFAETNSYQEIYHPLKSNSFLISITGSPFDEARKEAEEQFLRSVGLSKDEACALNVSITTPSYANPNESGIIYHLSFCQ